MLVPVEASIDSEADGRSTLVRSVLFVPGDDERKLAKAAGVVADALIVDLEDAVAASRKDRAVAMLSETLGALAGRRVFVRVNALDTGRTADELAALSAAGADGAVVPKVTGPDDIAEVEAALSHGGDTIVALVPLVETAAAFVEIAAIAAASSRIERLAFGSADLARDLGIEPGDEPGHGMILDAARAALVFGSRAARIGGPLDGPLLAVRDLDRFEAHCVRARGMGFAGVLCLHPDQVAVANAVFTPSDGAIAKAQRIVDAFATHERDGQASIVVDGAFVDYPIAESARALLARADQIAAAAPSSEPRR